MTYNPYEGWPVTGTWLEHLSYSLGGTDYPLGYGTNLPAPGTGTLRTSGGLGEFAAGWVGSAGRRAILTLDTPVKRQIAAQSQEGSGDMVAVVFQHASEYNAAGRYSAGEIIGKSGASADGVNYGGDIHLHIHGLNAAGQRVDFTKYIDGTTSTTPPTTPAGEEMTTFELVRTTGTAPVFYSVNRIHRYHVPNESMLNDYKFFISAQGQSAAVKEVVTIASFGAVVA